MTYKVIAQSRAVADAEVAREFLARQNPEYAERWMDELDELFAMLAEFPNRFAVAPEAEYTTYTVRHTLVGRYRVLYVVREDTVRIMRIYHSARPPLDPKELE